MSLSRRQRELKRRLMALIETRLEVRIGYQIDDVWTVSQCHAEARIARYWLTICRGQDWPQALRGTLGRRSSGYIEGKPGRAPWRARITIKT